MMRQKSVLKLYVNVYIKLNKKIKNLMTKIIGFFNRVPGIF